MMKITLLMRVHFIAFLLIAIFANCQRGDDMLMVSYEQHIQPDPRITTSAFVTASTDDYEEVTDGTAGTTTSTDLELGFDTPDVQVCGVRFLNLNIPKGATITNAYIQFEIDEATGAASPVLDIKGELADSPATFAAVANNILNRTKTTATVTWSSIPQWNTIGERGLNQRTPNISSIIQEIVNQANYDSTDPIALFLTSVGTNEKRTAKAWDLASGAGAASLHVTYEPPTEGVPVVESFTQNVYTSGINNMVVNKPTGVVAGDLLLTLIANAAAETTVAQWDETSDPTGWTFGKTMGDAASDSHIAYFYKIADGTEGSTFTFGLGASGSSNPGWISCIRISGADPNNPVGNIVSSTTGNGSTFSIPSLATSENNALAIYQFTADGSDLAPFTVSGAGWSETDEIDNTNEAAGGTEGAWGQKDMPSIGLTGTADITMSLTDGYVGWILEILSGDNSIPPDANLPSLVTYLDAAQGFEDLKGNVTVTNEGGVTIVNDAYDFSGTGDVLNLGQANALDWNPTTQPFTVVWQMGDNIPTTGFIYAKGWNFQNMQFGADITSGTHWWYSYGGTTGDTYYGSIYDPVFNWPDGQTIALVNDGTEVYLYIDGVQVGTGNGVNADLKANIDLLIGGRRNDSANNGVGYEYNGSLRKIAFYNAVLTRDELRGIDEAWKDVYQGNAVLDGDMSASTNYTLQNGSTIAGGVGTVIANGSITSTGSNWSIYQDNVMLYPFWRYKVKFRARQTVGTGALQVGMDYTPMFNQAITTSWQNYEFVYTMSENDTGRDRLTFGGITVSDQFEIDDISVQPMVEHERKVDVYPIGSDGWVGNDNATSNYTNGNNATVTSSSNHTEKAAGQYGTKAVATTGGEWRRANLQLTGLTATANYELRFLYAKTPGNTTNRGGIFTWTGVLQDPNFYYFMEYDWHESAVFFEMDGVATTWSTNWYLGYDGTVDPAIQDEGLYIDGVRLYVVNPNLATVNALNASNITSSSLTGTTATGFTAVVETMNGGDNPPNVEPNAYASIGAKRYISLPGTTGNSFSADITGLTVGQTYRIKYTAKGVGGSNGWTGVEETVSDTWGAEWQLYEYLVTASATTISMNWDVDGQSYIASVYVELFNP